MLISQSWEKPSYLSKFVQLLQIFFFSVNLARSKSQYVYDKQTYLHTHFKKSWENFNPLNIQQK